MPLVSSRQSIAQTRDELHVGLDIPKQAATEVYNWVQEQDWPEGTELEPLEDYHITMLFAQGDGASSHRDAKWIKPDAHAVTAKGLKEFPPNEERNGLHPIVLLVESDTIYDHHNKLAEAARDAGVDPGPYSGDKYVPHMTIAYGPGLPKDFKPPKLTFETAESSVSTPREEKESSVLFSFVVPGREPPEVTPESTEHEAKQEPESRLLHHWRIAHVRAPYEAELLKFADSWNSKDQWPNALRERNGEPVDADCTCKDGEKLQCPIHGLHPVHPEDRTLEFPNPASPVGYDYHADGPRTWMRAETSYTETDDDRRDHSQSNSGRPDSRELQEGAGLSTPPSQTQRDSDRQDMADRSLDGFACGQRHFAKKRRLWLDDTRKPPDADWDWARNVAEAQHMLQEENREYDEMSLDHDLGMVRFEGKAVINPDALSGGDFCLWLHEHGDKKHMPKRVTLHTHNLHAVEIMYKALEPHTEVKIEQAPDHLEEDWAREYKVHEPSEIKEEEIHLPEKVAQHQLAWLPGSHIRGKGLVTPSGDVHTWPVDKDGIPHHAEYVDKHVPYQPGEGTAYFFQIRPRGGLDTHGYKIPANIINHILQTLPGLHEGESTDWHFGADKFDTREYQDSRMMPPMTLEPNATNPHPEKRGCTCDEGLKLTCPVHGLEPTEEGYDHSWSIPQGHPVGYPQDQPRNYMKAEGSSGDDGGEQDDADANSSPDENGAKQSAHESREADEEQSVRVDAHDPTIANCECPACRKARGNGWAMTGLPRAEGAVDDEDEHEDNLEGDSVAVPDLPEVIKRKRREQKDRELVQESLQ